MTAPETTALYAPFVTAQADGTCVLVLSVEGVHCPACIQKIESALSGIPAVTAARLNYTTKRLKIAWQGQTSRADDFITMLGALGYKAHPFEAAKAEASDSDYAKFLRLCLGVSGFASGNIMLLSFALWLTDTQQMGVMTRELFHLISALIAVPTVAFAGRPFFRSALAVLSKGRTNMDVPISLGIVLATGMSLFEMWRGAEHVFFDSAVMLIFFLLIGKYLDSLALANARRAAGDLLSMMAGSATIIDNGRTREVLIRDLRAGMLALVGAGERIPADGHVLEGRTDIDTSPVTGESLPMAVTAGAPVYSGTINISAPIKMTIAKAAEDSLLADIIRMMEKAEQGQARYVRIADRAAKMYTPVVHVLAAATFIYWLALSALPWQDAMMIAVTVLIITCPCALGLAVPVVQVLAVGGLTKRGILVKSGDALERLASIDTIMFDKTGTLTRGLPALQNASMYTEAQLKFAASAAVHSKHPLSLAICRAYAGPLYDATVSEIAGCGLEGYVNGTAFRLGSRDWCGDSQAPSHNNLLEIWLSMDGHAPIAFRFHDPLREDAIDTVASLKQAGLKIILASGDRLESVEAVAATIQPDSMHAAMKPADKFEMLHTLHAEGRHVMMVGDGLNDAPVLAGADVSASPASGLDIARNAADIVYTGERFAPVSDALKVAHLSQKLVRENFALAIAYNIFAVPMAMAGMVTPLVAAIAMSSSSIVVIANAFRLKRAI